jgi:tetratricopeptide (TPR) repeat protein
MPINKDYSVEEMLVQTQKILQNLPESSPSRSWLPVLDYLFFEYYVSIGQTKQAQLYYEKVNGLCDTILLYNNIAFTPNFLITKIVYLQEQGRIAELQDDYLKNFLYDPEDSHSMVMLGIYNAMISFYAGKHKEAAARLNEILNINSFKDFFHINTDIKLSLAYFYLCLKEFELADSILKNVSRKIKSDSLENYTNVIDLIKVFNEDIKQGKNKTTAKQKDYFTLFLARNVNENKLISPLVYELKKKYT